MQDIFGEELKKILQNSKIQVPKAYDKRIEETLSNISAKEKKPYLHFFYSKTAAMITICITVFASSLGAGAAINLYHEKMQSITQEDKILLMNLIKTLLSITRYPNILQYLSHTETVIFPRSHTVIPQLWVRLFQTLETVWGLLKMCSKSTKYTSGTSLSSRRPPPHRVQCRHIQRRMGHCRYGGTGAHRLQSKKT